MPLRILVLADPLDRLNPRGDSSIALAESALSRGHTVEFTDPSRFWRRDEVLTAEAQAVLQVAASEDHAVTTGAWRTAPVSDWDVVLMRKDPPIDAAFTMLLHLLAGVEDQTLVVNHPTGLLRFSEKLMAPSLLRHMPPTLVSLDRDRILAFIAEQGDTVVKPLYRNGGFGVVRLTADSVTAKSVLELYLTELREPIMAQTFLPAVFEGDKRVILMGDRIAGAINRRPDQSDFRSNMVVGGAAEHTTLTPRETTICEDVLEEMDRQGVLFAGLDLIGETLTEVNVTSPTGLRPLQALSGVDAAALFWDAIEARLS